MDQGRQKPPSSGHACRAASSVTTLSGSNSTRSPTISATSCGHSCCPMQVEQWSLTTLREKLVKIGAKIVRHGRYIVFQMAEVAIPRDLFADILRRIDRLRTTPLPT